jgi:hypothetical protein
MQQGGIDDQFPNRVDQCHVERREAAYAADIDSEIESVTSRDLDQGGQRPACAVRLINSRSCSFSKR